MRLFLKNIVFFFTFAGIVYGGLLLIYGHVHLPGALKGNLPGQNIHALMFRDLQQTGDIDVLFIGPSHCYRSFDPRVFQSRGYRSFNMGTSSQTPMQAIHLLREYMEQLNPETVIYEVYPLIFTRRINPAEPAIQLVANESPKRYLWPVVVQSHDIRAWNSFAANYLGNLFFGQKRALPSRWGKDVYVGNGFVERDMEYNKPVDQPQSAWVFDEDQFHAFEAALSLLHQRGTKVILVCTPISSRMYHSFANNAAFDARMRSYGEYYNFNTLMQTSDSLDFYDADHMNRNGVIKFNRRLMEVLDSTGALRR